MKKLLLLLFISNFSLLTAQADEGMWTLYNLPNAVYETMKQENYELPYGALGHCIKAMMPSRTAWSTSEAIALVWLYRLMDSCLPTTIAVSRPSAPIPPLSTTIC